MKIYPAIVSALLLSSSFTFLLPRAFAPPLILNSSWGTPNIDGSIGFGEWDLATKIDFPNGYVTVRNDLIRLYVLVNIVGDTTNDPIATPGDFFWLTFDVDQDKHIDANLDVNYGTIAPDSMRFQYYLDAATWTPVLPTTRSSLGRGFGCFFADGSAGLGIRFDAILLRWVLEPRCDSHRVWEIAIDLEEIATEAGGTAEMGLRVHSETPLFTDDTPADFFNDFHDLITVNLAESPDPVPAANAAAVIGLEADPVEVTQAIQTRDNALPLVANKKTVARSYVDVNGVGSSQPSMVFLYGTRGGSDLPGSPLAMFHMAPTVINRETLSHTANFLLPKSWTSGTVSFTALVRDLFGNEDSSGSFPIGFSSKSVPTYWIVPVPGAGGALASNAEINSQQGYLEATYPLRDVNFVRKSWSDVPAGCAAMAGVITQLNCWYDSLVGTLPDQIYGFRSSGGGLSDPIWGGGDGVVAYGFRGTSLEGTMAHEINHNLDTSAGGTWGRHVPFDCGAGGPDPSWPAPPNNDDIREVGLDTRGTFTVAPADFPDFMSYCQSGTLPTKWISGYRWQELFDNFPSPFIIICCLKVMYITGFINFDGTGDIDPILIQDQLPSMEPGPSGDYAIQQLSANGTILSSTPIMPTFVDMEGDSRDRFDFGVKIPQANGAVSVRLVRIVPDTVAPRFVTVDHIMASQNPPTVQLLTPNGGETSPSIIEWVASDPDGDPLSFAVYYSTDNGDTQVPGSSWTPLATRVTGNTLAVDWSKIPGADMALVRVVATDGFHNAMDQSDGLFSVPRKPPEVAIVEPKANIVVRAGEEIQFKGIVMDLEDETVAPERLSWSFGNTAFGTGPTVSAALPPGIHQVTLRAVDSHGGLGEAITTVVVLAPPPVVVGGPTVPIDKAALVVPWIPLLVLPIIATAAVGLLLLRRKKQNQSFPPELSTVP